MKESGAQEKLEIHDRYRFSILRTRRTDFMFCWPKYQ
jgi:hypothetical protein